MMAHPPYNCVVENFREFFDEFYPPVYRLLAKRGFDREECRELAQETFLRAYRAHESFRGDVSPSIWLCSIAANVFKKEPRRRRAAPWTPSAPTAHPRRVARQTIRLVRRSRRSASAAARRA